MARPRKHGLEYFPLDCHPSSEEQMLDVAYGNDGFVVWIRLLRAIYQTERGELDISDVLRRKMLAKQANITEDAWVTIIKTCAEIGLLDREAYTDGILTSSEIKATLLKVNQEREKARQRAAASSTTKKPRKTSQRKGKGKGKKEEDPDRESGSSSPHGEVFITLVLNTGDDHPVFMDEIEQYRQLYPAVNVEQELRNIKGWLWKNQGRRKTKGGIGRFINTWLAREQNRGGGHGYPRSDNQTVTGEGQPGKGSYKERANLTGDTVSSSREEFWRSQGVDIPP